MKRLSVLLAMTSIFMGCKKNNDKISHCRIVSITSPLGSAGDQLVYNSDHELERVISGSAVDVYTYSNNNVIIDQYDSGTLRQKATVTLNAAGLATNVRTEYDLTGANWGNSFNEYNGDEIIRNTSTSSGGAGTTSVTTFGWSNGDMVWATAGTDTTRFEYYTDQLRVAGDFLSLLQMLQGYEIYRTRHLIKSYAGATFQYDRAADGKITSLQYYSGNSMSILDYGYDCN